MDALADVEICWPIMALGTTADLPPVNDRTIADEGDMRNFVSGQWILWVMGRVEYDDANKQHHVTNFREYYDYTTNGYKAADKGNDDQLISTSERMTRERWKRTASSVFRLFDGSRS